MAIDKPSRHEDKQPESSRALFLIAVPVWSRCGGVEIQKEANAYVMHSGWAALMSLCLSANGSANQKFGQFLLLFWGFLS